MENSDFCYNCFKECAENECTECGYKYSVDRYKDNNMMLPPGTILYKKYKVGRILGVGGFGITYKAQNIETGKIVAVKEYVPMNITYRDEETNEIRVKVGKHKGLFNNGLMAFIEEVNFIVMLKNHESIVNIYDCFNENNTAYYVMEFLEGYTLNRMSNKDYMFIYNAMIKTAKALKIVHSMGIVHRDVSPQNIFLLKNSEIKLIDFGNARYFNKNNANDDELILKPGFAPPELYMKKNVQGPWTDIYSLAATFYNIFTDTRLPSALDRINGVPTVPIRRFVPNIEYGIETALNRALELDYANRQQSIDEFFEDIDNPCMKNTVHTENLSYNTDYSEVYVASLKQADADKNNRKIFIKKGRKSFKDIKNKGDKIFEHLAHKSIVNIPEKSIKSERKNSAAANNEIAAAESKGNIPNKQRARGGRTSSNLKTVSYIQSYDGRLYLISDIKDVIIGRNASTSHITINDVNISRKHCVVRFNSAKGEFCVTDWSVNGTFIQDSTRLSYGVEYKIVPEQLFYLFLPKYSFKVVLRNE